jgi:hypothetical protein
LRADGCSRKRASHGVLLVQTPQRGLQTARSRVPGAHYYPISNSLDASGSHEGGIACPGGAHLRVSDNSDNKLRNSRLPLRLAQRTCFAGRWSSIRVALRAKLGAGGSPASLLTVSERSQMIDALIQRIESFSHLDPLSRSELRAACIAHAEYFSPRQGIFSAGERTLGAYFVLDGFACRHLTGDCPPSISCRAPSPLLNGLPRTAALTAIALEHDEATSAPSAVPSRRSDRPVC